MSDSEIQQIILYKLFLIQTLKGEILEHFKQLDAQDNLINNEFWKGYRR